MTLCAFTKLFQKEISHDDKPLALTTVSLLLQTAKALISLNLVPLTLPSCEKVLSLPRQKA